MSDLVERLRQLGEIAGIEGRSIGDAAADEIERLQALLNAEMDSNRRLSAVELRLRGALRQLDSVAQDPKNVRIMRQVVRKIVGEAIHTQNGDVNTQSGDGDD